MYALKKAIAPLLYPFPLCLELLAIGLGLLWFTKRQRLGKIVVALAFLLLVCLGSERFSGWLIQSLESQYPAFDGVTDSRTWDGPSPTAIRWIVVLAGGVTGDPSQPVDLQISHHSRVRLLEGIRLHRLFPGSKLILSGGLGYRREPEASILSRVAQRYGVKKRDIVIEAQSRDTKDHPRFISAIVKDSPFILVTSAYHMPRAMRLFEKHHLTPIPAPTGHWKPAEPPSLSDYFPSPRGLRLAEWTFHEYLGMGWAWLRGQI